MEIIHLRALAGSEIANVKPTLSQQLFDADFGNNVNTKGYSRLDESLADYICKGGYPAAIKRRSDKRRNIWYRDYITSILQRDIKDISNIKNLEILPNRLALSASQTARLFNASDLAAPFGISRLSRLIKTPEMHMTDTGLACSLMGINSQSLWQDKALLGQLLETFIYQELRKYADWHDEALSFFHFRNKDKVEVDIIIEQNRKLVGVEIKAAATITSSDFKGLRKLQDATAEQFAAGVVFYDGENILPFGERLFALPISMLIPQA
jgi:predicted AAA+ superfamily ATPase